MFSNFQTQASRSYFSLVLAVFIFLFVSSCKEILDVKRTFTFSQEFTITDGQSLSFSAFEVVDMGAAESLIAEYGSKIKKIEIEELKYWFKDYDGPDGQTLSNLVFDVARADGTNVTNVVSLSDVVLAGLANNPTLANVNNDGVALAGELIKNPPHNLKFLVNGSLNEGPISFTAVFDLTIKMTANPLNK
jgi:hypothetical protein